MTSRRLVLLLPLLLLALVGGALLLVMGEGDADAPDAHDDPAARSSDETAPGDGESAGNAARRAQRPGSVGGVVRRFTDRTPVVGHPVELTTSDGATLAVRTGEDGSFVFPSVPPGGPHEVRVPTDEFAPVAVPGLTVVSAERLDLGTLWLAAGVPVVVEVRTFTGRPLAGATVRAFVTGPGTSTFDTPFDPPAVATAVSDGQGHATFAGLPPGSWTLTAERSGYARRGLIERQVRADVPEERFRIALEKGYRLTGRILETDGRPVPGAPVLAIRRTLVNTTSTSPLALRTVTDADGRYVFEALPAADVVIWAGRPGERLAVLAAVRLPGVRELDIVLSRGGRFEARVLDDETGEPIPGAKVSCDLEVLGAFSLSFEAVTDGDGSCAFDFPMPGRLTSASAAAPGHLMSSFDLGSGGAIELPTGIVSRREVRLTPGTIVTGTVTGPDGPLADAQVGATNPQWWFDTRTDAAGRYTLPALPRERFCLLVNVAGYRQPNRPGNPDESIAAGTTPPELVADATSGAPLTVDLTVERGGSIRGRVERASDGGPVSGARVTVDGRVDSTVVTDDEGRFSAAGPHPGDGFWLNVEAAGFRDFAQGFDTSSDPDADTEHVVRLQPALRVVGVVRTDDGTPLDGAYVQVSTFDRSVTDPTYDEWDWLEGVRLPVAADGTFDHLVAAVTDTMLVRAGALGRRRADSGPLRIAADQTRVDLELVLEAGLSLSGRAVTLNGDPIPGARVQGTPMATGTDADDVSYPGAWGPPIVAVADAEGRFTLAGLEDEHYLLRVSAQHFLPERVGVGLPATGDVVVELIESREIRGRAAYTDGAPVAGAEVAVHRLEGENPSFWGETRTSSDGSFVVEFLQSGPHRLTLRAAPETPQNVVTVVVEDVQAGPTDVFIEAEYGLEISGVVLLPDGTPTQDEAMIRAYRDDTQIAWAQTGEQGRFELLGIGPGDVRLTIESDSMWGTGSVVRTGVAAGTRDLSIRLPAPSATSGRLIGPDGEPLPNVGIMFLPEEASVTGVNVWQVNGTTGDGGAFEIYAIPSARYRAVLPWDDQYMLERDVIVIGGGGGITLQATRGEAITGRVVSEDGEPVPEAWISVSGENASRGGRADADGNFEVWGLHPGIDYTVGVSCDGWISPNATTAQAGRTGLTLEMERGLPFAGRVVDADGNPIPEALVQLERAKGGWSSNVWTDGEGNFRVETLKAGDYDVDVLVTLTGETYACGRFQAGDTEAVLRCAGR